MRGLPLFAMFNPKVTRLDDSTATVSEACLSVPDAIGRVTRSALVRVDFLDESARPRQAEFRGFWSCVVQHENDHLDGVLFTDKLDVDARGQPCLWSLDEYHSNDLLGVFRNAESWCRWRNKLYRMTAD